jgi:hypothetical protein
MGIVSWKPLHAKIGVQILWVNRILEEKMGRKFLELDCKFENLAIYDDGNPNKTVKTYETSTCDFSFVVFVLARPKLIAVLVVLYCK